MLQNVSDSQSETAQKKPHVDFFDNENSRLHDKVSSLHTSLIHWMVDLLVLMVPDQDQYPHDQALWSPPLTEVRGLDHLEGDARALVQRLEHLSQYISSSCQLIMDEELQKNAVYDADSQIYEHNKLQRACSDWIETCQVLLLDVKRGPVDLSINPPCPGFKHPDPAPDCTDSVSSQHESASHQDDSASQQHDSTSNHPGLPPATTKRYSSAPRQPSSASKPLVGDPEVLLSPSSHRSLREPSGHDEEEEEEGPEEGAVSAVKMIGYDRNITERTPGRY
ncbi:hypothetical protein CRUP_009721, partial [Coryphaenoides rupestris]